MVVGWNNLFAVERSRKSADYWSFSNGQIRCPLKCSTSKSHKKSDVWDLKTFFLDQCNGESPHREGCRENGRRFHWSAYMFLSHLNQESATVVVDFSLPRLQPLHHCHWHGWKKSICMLLGSCTFFDPFTLHSRAKMSPSDERRFPIMSLVKSSCIPRNSAGLGSRKVLFETPPKSAR